MSILLVDGYNLLYRSFTILPDSIRDTNDRPIHGVYGFLGTLFKMVRDRGVDRVVVALDDPTVPTFRHQLYSGYQAQRGPLGGDRADDFARQVTIARQVLPTIGIPAQSVQGYEADDVMGTIAVRAAASGTDVTVVSTDRDLLQLVRPGVSILVPGRDRWIRSSDEVRDVFGVGPEGVTSLKALAGDASDNIPGVRGIGMKTAARLVNEYGSLEGVLSQAALQTARVARALQTQADDARLFHRLVTIVTDLDVPDIEKCPLSIPEGATARKVLDEAGLG